jgi:hypothetical protein
MERKFVHELGGKLKVGVQEEAAWKDRAPREMIGKDVRRGRHDERGARDLSSFATGAFEGQRWQSLESAGGRAFSMEPLEARPDCGRVIELLHRHHRADAVSEPKDRDTFDAGAAAIGHRVVVSGFEFRSQRQRLAGVDGSEQIDTAGDARDRAALETHRRHCRPGCQLSNRFGDERKGEVVDAGRNPVTAADVATGLAGQNSINE